jgi:hypothetical protein
MVPMNGPTQADVDSIPHWLHPIEFPNGVTVRSEKPPQQAAAEAERAFRYPVAGKSVLDVGA